MSLKSTSKKKRGSLAAIAAVVLVLFAGGSAASNGGDSHNASLNDAQKVVEQLNSGSNGDVTADAGIPAVAINPDGGIDAVPYVEPAAQSQSAAPAPAPAAGGNLVVRFLNVGQGDSALLSCGGEYLLIDGGPSKASDKLYSIMRDLNITSLKAIIATHPDADHIGGLAGALRVAKPATFYCSTTTHDTKTWSNVVGQIGAAGITIPAVGNSFTLGAATVTFLGPVGSFGADSNNGSLICKVTLGTRSFLFTGDAENESEGSLSRSGSILKADVLKVGHHGSKSSTSQAFLAKVAPAFAVISVGKNSYGHPTNEVLSRLTGQNAQVLRTDQQGHIIFTTDGNSLTYVTSSKITD